MVANHPQRFRRPGLWWIHDRNRKRRNQTLSADRIGDPGRTLVIYLYVIHTDNENNNKFSNLINNQYDYLLP